MKKVSLTINDVKIIAAEGETLLRTALENGIYIPNLCALITDDDPVTSCRLCFVEIEGIERPVTACTETVKEGMVVNTRGSKALHLAKTGFELLMASHPVDCADCPANKNCELQKIAVHLKINLKTKRFEKILRNLPADTSHPEYVFDPDKCVLCGKCVRICREKGCGVFGFTGRGFNRRVTTFLNTPLSESNCSGCGACIDDCPTGALARKT